MDIIKIGTIVWTIHRNCPATGVIIKVTVEEDGRSVDNAPIIKYYTRMKYNNIVEYSADEVFLNKTALLNWFKQTIKEVESEKGSIEL